MKCQENRCKHFIDGIWCEVFEDIPMGKNCYGAFEPIEKMVIVMNICKRCFEIECKNGKK